MNFLTDQDVYRSTVVHLEGLGHDVATAASLGLATADDADILRVAQERNRILVTRDQDFGGLVFVHASGAGVIYLRMVPATLSQVHDELAQVLAAYPETELLASFVVVEAGRHRIKIPPPQSSSP